MMLCSAHVFCSSRVLAGKVMSALLVSGHSHVSTVGLRKWVGGRHRVAKKQPVSGHWHRCTTLQRTVTCSTHPLLLAWLASARMHISSEHVHNAAPRVAVHQHGTVLLTARLCIHGLEWSERHAQDQLTLGRVQSGFRAFGRHSKGQRDLQGRKPTSKPTNAEDASCTSEQTAAPPRTCCI